MGRRDAPPEGRGGAGGPRGGRPWRRSWSSRARGTWGASPCVPARPPHPPPPGLPFPAPRASPVAAAPAAPARGAAPRGRFSSSPRRCFGMQALLAGSAWGRHARGGPGPGRARRAAGRRVGSRRPQPPPLPPPPTAPTPPRRGQPPHPSPSPRPCPGALEGGGWPHAGEQGASGVWSCAGARGLERLLATRAAFSRGTDRRRRRGRPPWGVGRPST